MPAVIVRVHEALNQHNLESFLECIDEHYWSEQPVHPNRGFGGKEQVRKNWSAIFESFPDFEADLLRHTSDGDTVWSEWHWTATGLHMAGVILMGVENDRIVWGRLYMEPVEEDGEDIDAAVQRMTAGGEQSEEASPT